MPVRQTSARLRLPARVALFSSSCSSRTSLLTVFFLHRCEEAALAQFPEHAAVDIVGGIAAGGACADLEHVLDTAHRDVHVGRRLRAEILVADVDDLRIV